MIDQLLRDADTYPQIFRWCGTLSEGQVDEWSSQNQVNVPVDLKQLWVRTRGGDIFESETILSPLATSGEYDIDSVNEFYWSSWVNKQLLIFHLGLCISGIRNEFPHFIAIDARSYRMIGEFEDVDSWYHKMLRTEYARRYGLS